MSIQCTELKQIEKSYDEIKMSEGSYNDLKNKISQYEKYFPISTKYYYALFYHECAKEAEKADQIITNALSELEKSKLTPIEIFLGNSLLIDVYGLAGEIYAHNNKPELSLRQYQNYQLYLSRIKSTDIHDDLLTFRNYNEYTLSDLINNEVTLCSPRVMNDPYDTLLLKWGEHFANDTNHPRKHIGPLLQSMESYRIRSFCKLRNKENDNMIGNILMWSHYAGQHKGFCIQYHFSDQFTNATTEKRTTRLKEIIYRNNKDALDITRSTIDTNIGLCTKHIDWQYENEVRLISYELGSSDLFCPVPLDDASYIKCIYFGYKCDDKNIRTIKKILANKPEIEYYKMKSDYKDIFRLTPQKIL